MTQGWDHRNNLVQIYALIRKAMDEEFREDGPLSLNGFCLECFNESQFREVSARAQGIPGIRGNSHDSHTR